MFRRFAGSSLALLLATVAQVGHAQSAGWSAPATLGTSSLYFMSYNGVSVAASPQPLAQSVAVWTEPSTMTIRYAVKRLGAWSKAKTLYKANANASENVTDPQVVLDAAGNATAVWGSTKLGPVIYCFIGTRIYRCPQYISYAKSATLAPGATAWTKAANLSAKGWFVNDVQAGVDAAGNAIAAWTFKPSSAAAWELQSAVRAVGGSWAAPTSLHSASAIGVPQLAVGAGGDAVLGWVESSGAPAVGAVYEESFTAATGRWNGAPVLVASQPGPITWLRAAFAGDTAALAWTEGLAAVWARRTGGGAWGIPEVLSAGPALGAGPVSGPLVAGDAAGNFVAGWLRQGAAPDGGNTIEVRRLMADGTVSDTSWPVGTNTPPSVVASPDGSAAFVAWLDETDFNVYATETTTSGSWTEPVVVSAGASQYSAVWGMGIAAAAAPNRGAALVWLSVAGPSYQIKLLASTR